MVLFAHFILGIVGVMGFVPSSALALGKKRPAPVECQWSIPASVFEKWVDTFLERGPRANDGLRPPAAALYLLDRSGKVERKISEKNAHEPSAVASTQKLVTAWLAAQNASLAQTTPFTAEDDWHDSAHNGNPAQHRNGNPIQVGETVTLRELLQTLLEQSSNGAASALARATTGDDAKLFVKQMNFSAKVWMGEDAYDTYFQNPSGLTDSEDALKLGELATLQHSTANNLARMAGAILAKDALPDFQQQLESLEIANTPGPGIFEKFGRTRAAGFTVVTHWRLPASCGTGSLVLTAFGNLDADLVGFISQVERSIGISGLRRSSTSADARQTVWPPQLDPEPAVHP